jgi:hypothetical protein
LIQPLEVAASNPQSTFASVISRDAAWLNELEQAQHETRISVDPRSLGTFEPHTGFLVLEGGDRTAYAQSARLLVGKDGRLVDDRDRAVVGYILGGEGQAIARPIRVPKSAGGHAYARYEIDERGVLLGIPSATGTIAEPVPLAQVAVAVFPAPQNLVKVSDVLSASREAGAPLLWPADAVNIGGLIREPTDAPTAELQAEAREAYIAGAQAELQVALSSSRDDLIRVALDVVK